MAKYISIVVMLVVMVVVVSMLCDAQDSNRNNNNNNNRRVRARGRGRQRGNSETSQGGRRPSRPSGGSSRPSRPSRPRRPSRPSSTGGSRGSRGRGSRRRQPHASCEEIYLPMCKGLVPYTHTKLPNRFNHTSQAEVYRVLEHKWAHMDHSCSKNLRLMVCSLYLPKCHGRGPGMPPCKRTCMTARRKCSRPMQEMLGVTWGETYDCLGLTNRRCVRPVRDAPCQHQYPVCVSNSILPVCANLTFTLGTVPNMFQQCDSQEIGNEVQYFDALVQSACHPSLKFLLCGVYSPFCVRDERPFTFPCRELCEEIRTACESTYRSLYHNLPWPNKLQCHRYPDTQSEGYNCVMPSEGRTHA